MFETATATIASYLPVQSFSLPLIGMIDLATTITALGIFCGLTALFWLLRIVLVVRLEALAAKTSGDLDDTLVKAVKSIRPWVYTSIALFVALQLYTLPDMIDKVVTGALMFAFVWQAIQIATCFIEYIVTHYLEKDEDGDGKVDPASATMSGMVTLMAKIVLWVFGVLFVLSNVGVEVTSLIAGLGIGGIAVAFALQGVLSDLFASFSIYFDKPFRIGDFIVIGADSGTVERIGIKSTRIRTLQGEELVVSNAELTTARVQNFKRMDERRIPAHIGIVYETPYEKLVMVNDIMKEIFDEIDGARFDRSHFQSFGDSALIFEIIYYIETADFAEFMNLQQQFNMALFRRFGEAGIEFAYPTQVIYSKTS